MGIEDKETLGEVLREQLEKFDGTPNEINQNAVAVRMGINQGTLSRIKNDRSPGTAGRLDPEAVEAMLLGYRLSETEARDVALKFGLRLPKRYYKGLMGSPATSGNKARHLGSVSAGRTGNGDADRPRKVSVPDWIAERYDLEDVFVLTVDGDSMVCDEVHKTIPEGSDVYFHAKLEPKPGEIVAVWLEAENMGVIKVCKPAEGYTVLESYNHLHPPIIVNEANPGRIQGVYLGKSDPSRFRF